MKQISNFRIVLISLMIFLAACVQENKKVSQGVPSIKFNDFEFDFGTISMGEKVQHRFSFKNTGNGDLYIKKVDSDCGCTVVNYEKGAILPGKESYIDAMFDSNGMPGLQIKSLTVYSNTTDSLIKLTLSATVDYSLEQGY